MHIRSLATTALIMVVGAAAVTATEPTLTPSASLSSSAASGAPAAAAAQVPSPVGSPVPAPPLEGLVLPDGTAFDLADLRGHDVLVYFGYTHCPDVCPQTLAEVYDVFAARPGTRALFVTVDPERDTPEFLAEWTEYLPDDLVAVTGSPGAIRRAADAYGVRYARVDSTSSAGYAMSHTADLYLIDAEGRYLLAYPFGTPAQEIVADLEQLDDAG